MPPQDIRRALLEADVALPVVRRFVERVKEKAVGVAVTPGVRPDQQLVKVGVKGEWLRGGGVVSDELLSLMGTERRRRW